MTLWYISLLINQKFQNLQRLFPIALFRLWWNLTILSRVESYQGKYTQHPVIVPFQKLLHSRNMLQRRHVTTVPAKCINPYTRIKPMTYESKWMAPWSCQTMWVDCQVYHRCWKLQIFTWWFMICTQQTDEDSTNRYSSSI